MNRNSSESPAALERLGRYRIVRPLSKGGMALVYEARRESLAGVSPRVAIKLILPEYTTSDTFQELFINEARLGASMHHQNLVQIQDFDQDGDRFFLVMEYVEGITLRRAISLCRRNNVHVPLGVIAEIGRQACDGLAYAHAACDEQGQHLELVHRDVKPSNLILNPQGVVKLVDFGISKGFRLVEKKGTVKGTWGYMAPEQANGREVGPATDVFGLATVLYELASRQPLFEDKTPDVVKRLLAEDHPARMAAGLDPSYGRLVGPLVRALQRDPRARFSNASEFGRALSLLLPDPISARDEVERFYEGVDALHKGLPIPEGTLSSGVSSRPVTAAPISSPSSPRPASSESDEVAPMPVGWLMFAVAGIALLGTVLVVGVLLYFSNQNLEPGDSAAIDPGLGEIDLSPHEVEPELEPDSEGGVVEPEPVRRPPPSSIPVDPVPVAVDPGGTGDEVEADTEEERVVVVRRAPEPEPPAPEPQEVVTQPAPPTPGTAEVEPPAATGPGFLTIGARQPAEVYIDGRYVRKVPLVRRELEPGTHLVTIQALDGRKKVFEVDIVSGETLRHVWDFDRSEWRP